MKRPDVIPYLHLLLDVLSPIRLLSLTLQSNQTTLFGMEGKEINQVKSFKYLGVLLDECLSFNNHVNYVRSKVASRLGLLSQLQGCLTTEAANKIYFSLVLPILSFCDMCFCPLGSTNRKTLERLK